MVENLIHIKLEYEEAIQSKKDVLYSEQNVIRIAKIIKRYQLIRMEELKIKINLQKALREIITNIKTLEKTLPQIEMPKILQHGKEEVIENMQTANKIESLGLDRQLEEIQRKLKDLER
jgi:hypothetical protein